MNASRKVFLGGIAMVLAAAATIAGADGPADRPPVDESTRRVAAMELATSNRRALEEAMWRQRVLFRLVQGHAIALQGNAALIAIRDNQPGDIRRTGRVALASVLTRHAPVVADSRPPTAAEKAGSGSVARVEVDGRP